MGQIVHTGMIVFGGLTALFAVLLALPNCRLREFLYRIGEWVFHRNSDFH